MKVGTDGVLLGAWAPIENAVKILDVGIGTGLIALMLAQRTNADIIGIDIDYQAVLQAIENIINSPWPDRIKVIESSLQEYSKSTTNRFDLIVSNPPYFINSTKTLTDKYTKARHTDLLTHEELIENAMKLLNPDGRICIILPVNEGFQCVDFAKKNGLFCTKQVIVFPKPNAQAKRLLIEFSMKKSDRIESEIVIETDVRHKYSPEFTDLEKYFYLNL